MSDITAATTAPGTTAPAPATGTAGTAPAAVAPAAAPAATEITLEQALAELNTWKGHARTWEDRAKENKTAKEQLDALEAAKLTETQRLQKELDEIKADKAKSDHAALVAGVAAAKAVPAALLTGTTQEDLEASAEALLSFRGTVKPPANDTAASGTQGEPITQVTQIKSIAGMSRAEILQAEKDGRLKDLYAGK